MSRPAGCRIPPPAIRPATGGRNETVLVPIRAEGSKAPLFCVHAQAGHVRLYQALAQHLDPDRPVYGLRSVVPDDGTSAAYRRFEDMAERYVRELRELQPSPPYILMGECDGAGLAYEIAQCFRRLGEEVPLLVLVDSFAHGGPPRRWFAPRPAYRVADTTRMLAHHLRRAARLSGPARQEYVTERLARLLSRIRLSVLSRGDAPTPELSQRRGFREALIAYTAAPYGGRVVVFRGAKLPWGVQPKPDLGWGELVRDLEVIELPDYFGTCILEPTVGRLADRLAQALDDALA